MLAMVKHFSNIFLIIFITISSCTRNNEDTEPTKSAFKNVDGWPDAVKMRRVGESFAELIENVQVDSSGAIWVLRQARTNPDKYEYNTYLEKYDSQGNHILSIPESAGVILQSFVVHPSGDVTIVELKESVGDPDRSYNVWLKRIRADGTVLLETPLRDLGRPEEKMFHFFKFKDNSWQHTSTRPVIPEFDDGDMVRIGKDVEYYFFHGKLFASGEDVYLLARTYGSKLYKFNDKLQLSWSRQIMPFLQTPRVNGGLAVDENSNVYVAESLDSADLPAWELHFGKTLDKEALTSSLFITQIDPQGHLKASRAFGKNELLSPAGLAVTKGILTVGGRASITGKLNERNHIYERNLFFLKAEIASGKIIDYKILKTQRDTSAHDFHVNAAGQGFFAGANDFIQVDTGSVIEFGQGYVLKIDEHGNKLSYLSFRGPRDTTVKSISLLGDGKLLFGGSFNGPITHTGDADRKQNFQWAMLGIADIN